MSTSKVFFLSLLIFLNALNIFSQNHEIHKCGELSKDRIQEELSLRGDHWGYSYDDLLKDLGKWGDSPFIEVDFIGKSVQNRSIWELKITSETKTEEKKHLVYIHVRTHPNEVQSFWVANEMIDFLISEDSMAINLREKCIFYIIPMYNPDGVELEYARKNANKIDIESNWYSDNIQPEVVALRTRFEELMTSNTPVELALNLHSAYKCKRYFVFHHSNGTSIEYTKKEKRFIDFVVSYFITGFQPWNFNITWKNGTPKQYPESWWWLNHGNKVLALTYEDGNCDEAGDFDKTAFAILSGIADFFNIKSSTSIYDFDIKKEINHVQCYPNPVEKSINPNITISYKLLSQQNVKLELYNLEGKLIKKISEGFQYSGWHSSKLNTNKLTSGKYLFILSTNGQILTSKMIVL